MNAPDSLPSLKSITLIVPGGKARAGWFPGAGREAIVEAVRVAVKLPPGELFHLETSDGIVVAFDDSLPHGVELLLVAESSRAAAGGALAAASVAAPIPIPGPKAYPIVGNLPDIQHPGGLLPALRELHAEYGNIFSFIASGERIYFCSSADIISEIQAAPEIFPKLVEGKNGLTDLADKSVGNALFTASDNDPMWHMAHRILMPAFGAAAIKNYYGRILEAADDLFAYLDSLAPGESFLVTDVMTTMTFEAIAYAAFNKRYHSIGKRELPPFVEAMNVVMHDSVQEQQRMLPDIFYRDQRAGRARADKAMQDEVDRIITERRAAMERGDEVPADLLHIMLTAQDRVTGLKLQDDNIRGQLITFLVAGHETTSGLLSYALYYLWKNPEVQEKLIAEADAVLGRDYSYKPTYEDCARLDYTQRVLKEALRLNPTAALYARMIVRDTTLDHGRYQVRAGDRIFFTLAVLHTDSRHWGENAQTFDPDRFLPEAEAARHPDAYHPFGMGMRACIGFQFALVEAKMVLARFAQRYLARPADPRYVLQEKMTLTVKPLHLDMVLDRRPETKGRFPARQEETGPRTAASGAGGQPITILYGSNMGASREIARNLSLEAQKRGFAAQVSELDEQAGKPWPTGVPVVIITSTYNGAPPDNAARFAAFIEKAAPGACKGVRYAVLGCGNRQWRLTFQKFPAAVHARLRELGAEPFLEIGAADADGDFESAVESWTGGLWKALSTQFAGGAKPEAETSDAETTVSVEIVNFAGASAEAAPPDRTILDQESFLSVVRVNRELQSPGSPRSTRHIEIPLPATARYAAGDHLGVFPKNPPALVEAIAARCGVTPSTVVLLSLKRTGPDGAGGLPVGVPIPVSELLSEHVDLTGPVTRRELRAWVKTADCPPDKVKLDQWLADFSKFVVEAKPSLMELLDKVPSVRMDLALLLTLRPPLKPRYYSISSSPRQMPDACSLTVGVHNFKAGDGAEHEGLCSNYLARCTENTTVRVVVKDTGGTFRMPADLSRSVILVGPGTGLAPLRGFLQERRALRGEGATTGNALLFFGCRGSGEDYIYRDELGSYLADGTLSLLEVAFSRQPGVPKTYVQDLIKRRAIEVAEAIRAGATILICGDARAMAPDVRRAFAEVLGATGAEELEKLEHENRYLQDVWA